MNLDDNVSEIPSSFVAEMLALRTSSADGGLVHVQDPDSDRRRSRIEGERRQRKIRCNTNTKPSNIILALKKLHRRLDNFRFYAR